MTAESQLISGKTLLALVKRGFHPLTPTGRQRGLSKHRDLSLQRLDRDSVKRCFDVVFSLSVLILFSPVYLLLALLIALSSQGPIFYIQERVGKDYKPFRCIKFRTMVVNADEVLQQMIATSPDLREEFEDNFKLKDDPRITWIGKFLRVTSLDEFPQFWNVLTGDMSLVGTRPPTVDEVMRYETHHWERLNTKPGITGEWQANGRSNITDFEDIVRMDIAYQQKWSVIYDLKLIWKTVITVANSHGAC